jgi:ligand-binding sensor domain-containing protein
MERNFRFRGEGQASLQKKSKYTPALPVINKIKNGRLKLMQLLLLVISCNGYCFSQTTFINHFTTKDGLPSNNCYFTLQDKKGYIWVASDAGVSRFDGQVFETFSVDDGLPDNQIIRLNEDRKGRIWFSALNGQLSYFYNGKIYNQNNNKTLKQLQFSGIITSFFEDSKGNIWFGTNKNLLARWNGKSLQKYSSVTPSNQFINAFVYEDKQGRIWSSNATSLLLFDGVAFKKVKQQVNPLSYKTALNLPNKTMFYLDNKGLNLKDGDRQKLTLKIDNSLLTNNPGYFYVETEKSVWLTNDGGVFHIDSLGKQTRYLHNLTTSQALKDDKGNMWFTTTNGIYMLPTQANRIFLVNYTHGLSNNLVKSVYKDKWDRLWLGMDNGIIDLIAFPGAEIRHLKLPDKKKFNSIKQLGADASGKNLFFSSDYGLGMIKNIATTAQQISYLKETNNFGFVLKNFSLSKDNQLAMSLSSGVVIVKDPFHNLSFSSSTYNEGTNFFSNRSYRVFYDSSQSLWFSNTTGLSQFADGRVNKWHQRNPLLTKRINDISQLPDGTMILATDGYGLLFFRDHQLIRHLTRADGLANNICKKIFIQGNYIWVITNSAVNKILLKGKYAIESLEYTSNLLDNDVNGMFIDRDTAYFATNHGLVFFANRSFDKTKEAPKVLISSIATNKSPLNPDASKISLPPADNNITFYYSAIDFQNNNITYRYRLKSGDSWTETRNRRLEFSSLEPGQYRFELCAKTNNSEWSLPIKVDFVLQEHFWQSIGFMVFLLLIASLSVYKIAVIVTKQQKDKEQQRLLLKNKTLMLEQQALQAMMNPHFVFNVMNSIQHYINTKDTSSANKILTGFARLIRKNLDICTKSFISLEEEIEYLTLYLSLEKKRFGEKFTYTINIEESIDQDETMIPSMILQPYIENAIWHGLMPQENGGTINIGIRHYGANALMIEITDDGIGIDNSLHTKKENHESKGMNLTQERINLINQIEANPIQITISQNGISGTTISIIVPNK